MMQKLWKAMLGAGFAGMLLGSVACGPDYPNCEKNEHCQESEQGLAENKRFCVQGKCQQCAEDSHCNDASMECNAGLCERIQGYCTSVGECGANEKCEANRCQPECTADGECGVNEKCEANKCVTAAECSSNMDCTDGKACKGGKCVESVTSNDCSLETLYFSYDSSTLDGSAETTLRSNADCIKSQNMPNVQLAGHADERGSEEYNIALGERRARATREYLRRLGVDNLSTISYGEEMLRSTCGEDGSDSCHRQNRRVEFNRQ